MICGAMSEGTSTYTLPRPRDMSKRRDINQHGLRVGRLLYHTLDDTNTKRGLHHTDVVKHIPKKSKSLNSFLLQYSITQV